MSDNLEGKIKYFLLNSNIKIQTLYKANLTTSANGNIDLSQYIGTYEEVVLLQAFCSTRSDTCVIPCIWSAGTKKWGVHCTTTTTTMSVLANETLDLFIFYAKR